MNDKCPCDTCAIRKAYARRFDFHFYGEDCFFVCEVYEKWKKANQKETVNADTADSRNHPGD